MDLFWKASVFWKKLGEAVATRPIHFLTLGIINSNLKRQNIKSLAFKTFMSAFLILLGIVGIVYYAARFFTEEWGTMDNEKKFSTLIFLGLCGFFLFRGVKQLKDTLAKKPVDE